MPDVPPLSAEDGDRCMARGDITEAEKIYERVVASDLYHPYAFGCLCATRYERTGDPVWWQNLNTFARSSSHPRVAALLRRSYPFFGLGLEYTSEAIINLTRNALPELGKTGASGLLSVSSAIESPSAILAVKREAFAAGFSLTVQVSAVQRPDPRLPRKAVDFQIWRYLGSDVTATPNIEQPPPEMATLVSTIAARDRYAADAWSYWAKDAAQSSGDDDIRKLLGVMVHPPEKPPHRQDMVWWHWLYRVQIAVALIISHVGTGWQDSGRRRALLSLFHGPMDWTVNAALIALVLLAQREPEIHAEVDRLLDELWAYTSLPIDTPYLRPLAWATCVHRNLPDAERVNLFAGISKRFADQ